MAYNVLLDYPKRVHSSMLGRSCAEGSCRDSSESNVYGKILVCKHFFKRDVIDVSMVGLSVFVLV